MSVLGIASSIFSQATNYLSNQNLSNQNQVQSFQTEFQQLGQALQSGNLSEAQQDYATLTPNLQNGTPNTNPIAQAFTSLGQALQSGNLTNAQQAFTSLQQDVQQASSQTGQSGHHHHHHRGGGSGGSSSISSSSSSNPFTQELSELGQALQSGNLTAAQQAYTTIQQGFQQGFQQFAGAGSGAQTSIPALNVAA